MKKSKPTIETEYDGLETAILLALNCKSKGDPLRKVTKERGGWEKLHSEMGAFCPPRPEYPREMLACDLSDPDRLYSVDINDLVVDPISAIGRGLELGMLCRDGTLKWALVKPMAPPKGLVAISNKPVAWFAWHWRTIKEGEKDTYNRRAMALSEDGVALMKPLGWKGFDANRERAELEEQLALTLSVFEDAQRSGSILATVQESARITFPVGGDVYKSFFALRDGLRETPTGRRNPILHWCSEHLRRTISGVVPVVAHERGVEEIVHGNMRLTIQPSEGYGAFMRRHMVTA